MNWEKHVFEPMGNFAHATEFLTVKKALFTLLSLNVNNTNIKSKKTTINTEKVQQLKKKNLSKNESEVFKP